MSRFPDRKWEPLLNVEAILEGTATQTRSEYVSDSFEKRADNCVKSKTARRNTVPWAKKEAEVPIKQLEVE